MLIRPHDTTSQGSLSNASNADGSVDEVDEEHPDDASQLMLDYTKKASLEVTKILRQVLRVRAVVRLYVRHFSAFSFSNPPPYHCGTV